MARAPHSALRALIFMICSVLSSVDFTPVSNPQISGLSNARRCADCTPRTHTRQNFPPPDPVQKRGESFSFLADFGGFERNTNANERKFWVSQRKCASFRRGFWAVWGWVAPCRWRWRARHASGAVPLTQMPLRIHCVIPAMARWAAPPTAPHWRKRDLALGAAPSDRIGARLAAFANENRALHRPWTVFVRMA